MDNFINKVICAPAQDFLKVLPDGCVDLTVTSPPYDDLRKYNGYSFPFEEIAYELYRVTKKGGVVVWVVGDQVKNGSETGTSFRQALHFMSIGFNLHDTMIYAKENYVPLSHNRYEQAFEYMFVFSKGKPKTFNPIKVKSKTAGLKRNIKYSGIKTEPSCTRQRDEILVTKNYKVISNIFVYAVGSDRSGHPAAFPEKLAADHISSWSNEGDIVLDPFSGSGTTAKIAVNYRRRFIACDISDEYCDLARKRIEPLLDQQRINF